VQATKAVHGLGVLASCSRHGVPHFFGFEIAVFFFQGCRITWDPFRYELRSGIGSHVVLSPCPRFVRVLLFPLLSLEMGSAVLSVLHPCLICAP
jgi:hypothetical protein